MSKGSLRPGKEEIKQLRKERKEAGNALRRKQKAEGLDNRVTSTLPNRKSRYQSVEEEEEARQTAVTEQMRIFRLQLPVVLNRLSKIKDPRNPKKTKHKLDALMIYGILMFVFQMSSRREANKEMTRPQFMESLQLFFPELEDMPHNDTLMRILSVIEVSEIERALMEAVHKLIKNKKLGRYLVAGRYTIAIDGTQKFKRDILWAEECSQREVKDGDDTRIQYHVNVLEANLVFPNGMSIPLMSEFSSYAHGDTETKKQDCEQKAFKRLAKRLKKAFPRLSIMVVLDGLYPNGPIMEVCRKNRWDFMIVLQDKSLPSVWEEYEGLKKLESNNRFSRIWGARRQQFEWVNDIEYDYGPNGRRKQIIHMVICKESWEEVAKDSAEIEAKESRHVWVSEKPFSKENVHERCNLCARHRWGIESGILIEKRHGYGYEHAFSYNWNAMKGYHYLLRLAHFINILAIYSECLIDLVREFGVRGFIRFVRETLVGRWLTPSWVQERLGANFQLRLI